MSPDPVRAIADAVLYEGYILWPYRRSALKNQRRLTFGGVYPPGHSRDHPDDSAAMHTEVLLTAAQAGRVEVKVRFLHVVQRAVDTVRVEHVALPAKCEGQQRALALKAATIVEPHPAVEPPGNEDAIDPSLHDGRHGEPFRRALR